jgi:adenosylcobinamide-GDP ribazoletransferase
MNATEVLRERLAELVAAVALLTRLPVPKLSLPASRGAESVWAYPLVGAMVGALGGVAYWLAAWLSLPPALAALCALAVMMVATGALHEDGLADFADGLAGKTPERRLAIMRDHEIGTYGVIALLLSLAIRATAMALMAAPSAVLAALIATDAAGRLAAVLVMAGLPPARGDGLSASVGQPGAGVASVALLITLAVAWLALSFGAAMLLIVAAGVSAAGIGFLAQKRLGGQTGDVLGAACQICQCLALMALVAA